MLVTDSGMKGRVKGLLGGTPGTEPLDHAGPSPDVPSQAQHQALGVLTLAQRTAEEHVANARRHADTIISDARARAEELVRKAQTHARGLQQDAEKALSEAHASAAKAARDAQAEADAARRTAEEVLSEARTKADEVAKRAQENADDLQHQAQQRYDDVVGSLAAKREALQRQIEALEQFDQEYRTRLTSFMQAQLRALWVDEPRVDPAEIDAGPVAVPAQASASAQS